MRRGLTIVVVALLILAGVGIGASAYNVGVDHGIHQQLVESGQGVQVVRVVGDRVGPGWGFFPFGFLFFPLFVFGIFALVRAATWRRRWEGPGRMGPGGHWEDRARDRFDEWHRREHDHVGGSGSGGEPA